MKSKAIVDEIEKILPQTQCGRCHFSGCKPYAEAIANNVAEINQCPPGGQPGIGLLAKLLGRRIKPLDAGHGEEGAVRIAAIREIDCIGCTKCIQVCPVDAILGAKNQMHTIIQSECTGCELCLPPCPVDCIDLEPLAATDPRNRFMDHPGRSNIAVQSKIRYENRMSRLETRRRQLEAQQKKKREKLQEQKKRLRRG